MFDKSHANAMMDGWWVVGVYYAHVDDSKRMFEF